MRQLVPVVVFTYNRLDETVETISSLQKNYLAQESDLYLFSDGARTDQDYLKVKKVRDYLKTINGFKSIHIKESPKNKGLANSIIDGVSEVIDIHGKVIVLEDDLVTTPNFLNFMNQALTYYEANEKILSISGYTLNLPSLRNYNKDFYCGYRASSLGWGCWKNRWEMVDWEISDYSDFIKNKPLREKFNRGGSDMTRMLKFQQAKKNDSWAIRFCYHQFKHDLLAVFPRVSMVQHIGISNSATNAVNATKFFTVLDYNGKENFEFDNVTKVNDKLINEFRSIFSIRRRALDKLKRIFK